jgi:hypothetical protein
MNRVSIHNAGLILVVIAALSSGCALHTRTTTISVGDKAPDFKLSDQTGTLWTLTDMISDGPAIVMFYRGYW